MLSLKWQGVEMTKKLWGVDELLLSRNCVEVHRMELIKGTCSSRHVHAIKHNLFTVFSGEVMIELYEPQKDDVLEVYQEIRLEAGDSYEVEPGIWHRFVVMDEGTVAIEIVWAATLHADIERIDSSHHVADEE